MFFKKITILGYSVILTHILGFENDLRNMFHFNTVILSVFLYHFLLDAALPANIIDGSAQVDDSVVSEILNE